MGKTDIEWTEQTWNPITGCTKVSAGCKNCYAEVIANRFWKDRKFTDVQIHWDRFESPSKVKKPTMFFVNSMSDLFHEKVSYEVLIRLFAAMMTTPQHTYQILTKRPERAVKYFEWWGQELTSNIWIGISVEDQSSADIRKEYLQKIPGKIRFVSYEPALAEVNWVGYEFINWIICGGESGAKKRPCNLEWFRKTRDWAKKNNIAFFMKQIDKVQEIPEDLFIKKYPLQNSL